MYLLIIFLPLIGSLFSGLFGRTLGTYGSCYISTSCVFASMILSWLGFYEVGLSGLVYHMTLIGWMASDTYNVNWGFLFDTLTVVMLIVITTISTLVHLYSISYMEADPHIPRFMSYLQLFTFCMIVLVTADNLVQLFLGWEGVGLASYLLINFWYTRLCANQAGIKALIVNRIGDLGLSLGILALFYVFGSNDYAIIFSLTPLFVDYFIYILGYKIHALSLICLFLFVGAVGKSAQVGLHTWLPDAMEGPTPVSALIHAATMVTAGVFLVVRFSPIVEYSKITLFVLTLFGSATCLFAAITGAFQNDLKRVIAYSTCSQLGYMMLACGLSCYQISMFHLFNHAFFKALLFLSAGCVIHAVADEQDMRKMGSMVKFLPLTYSAMLVGSLALMGFPFLTGFYSKDLIIEITQITNSSNLKLSYWSFSIWASSLAVFFTAFYSIRLIHLTFLNNCTASLVVMSKLHQPSFLMTLPLVVLSIGSIFVGYLMKDLFVGCGTSFWQSSIFILPTHLYAIESEWTDAFIKLIPFLLSMNGIFLAILLNNVNNVTHIYLLQNPIIKFLVFNLSKKWHWDKLYNNLITFPILGFGYNISFKLLDKGLLELLGPRGLILILPDFSEKITRVQTGQIHHYLFFFVVGIGLFLSLLMPHQLLYLDNYVWGSLLILLFFYN